MSHFLEFYHSKILIQVSIKYYNLTIHNTYTPNNALPGPSLLKSYMFIKDQYVKNILVFLSPEFPFQKAREHLHVKELLEERALILRGFLTVLLKVEASRHTFYGLDLRSSRLWLNQVLLIVDEDADKEVKEGHADLLDVFMSQPLLLLLLCFHRILNLVM